MAENNKKEITSFPFFGILTLIFITLKLTGHIAWSWWWVLAPLWGPIVVAILFAGLVGGIVAVSKAKKGK
jgi:ATP/ADP translocase